MVKFWKIIIQVEKSEIKSQQICGKKSAKSKKLARIYWNCQQLVKFLWEDLSVDHEQQKKQQWTKEKYISFRFAFFFQIISNYHQDYHHDQKSDKEQIADSTVWVGKLVTE